MGSWSITVNDLDQIEELPEDIFLKACGEDAELQSDAHSAFISAKERGLVSATISGGRTPSPYGGPDTVVISIVGFNNRSEGHAIPPITGRDFNSTMVSTILAGPDEETEPENDEDDGYLSGRQPYPDGDQPFRPAG